MRILFVNEALNATISGLYETENYPATNIVHPFLRKKYLSTGTIDTITLEWSSAIDLDSVMTGYTNAEGIHLKIFAGASVLFDNYMFSLGARHTGRIFTDGSLKYFAEADTTGFYPGTFTGVTKIELTLYSPTDPVYLGGVGVGVYTKIPGALPTFNEGIVDNSSVRTSPYGQVLINKVDPFFTRTFSIEQVPYATFHALHEKLKSLGNGGLAWVDFFEESHDIYPATYCSLTDFGNPTRSGTTYNMQITFTEAR